MAQQALGAGLTVPRKRALFGLLDADGWIWAGVKAMAWLVIIIMLLGYIPDRAYNLTVKETVELGKVIWAPVNFCSPENENLPCPAPVGAVVPWHPNPENLALPEARTDGAAVQVGTKLLYIGGSDGETASADVFVSEIVVPGNFDEWAAGPALPEPRTDASVISLSGTIYVFGGRDENGDPTTSVFYLTPNLQTGELGEWKDDLAEDLQLPEARAGAAVAAAADGVLLIGGDGPDGPVTTTWKSTFDDEGALTDWEPQAPLFAAQAGGAAVVARRSRLAVGRSRCERPGRGRPARRHRRGGGRGPARERERRQGRPVGGQRRHQPARGPRRCGGLVGQRLALPGRWRGPGRAGHRAVLGRAHRRRRPARLEAPRCQRPAGRAARGERRRWSAPTRSWSVARPPTAWSTSSLRAEHLTQGAVLPARPGRGDRARSQDRGRHRPAAGLPECRRGGHRQLHHRAAHRLGVRPQGAGPRA